MNPADMPRNHLVGVRLKPSELALLQRIREHLEGPHGVPVNDQTIMKMGLERLARELGVSVEPAAHEASARASTKTRVRGRKKSARAT